MNAKTWVVLGASLGALAVLAGALGDHYLPRYHDLIHLDRVLQAKGKLWWETAARYHMYHALALLAVAWMVDRRKSSLANAAGLAMFLGTLVFSGCLYAMGLTGIRLGAVVPFGGLLLIAGWVLLALSGAALLGNKSSEKQLFIREKESLSNSSQEPPSETDAATAEPAAESTS